MTNKKAIDIIDGLRMSYICDPNECLLPMYDKDNEACKSCDEHHDALAMAVKALKEVERHNETFEWCMDCKEYDETNHCCHRWTKQIRDTLEDVKQAASDKYRWHDLRKNPDDLPCGGEYLCLAQARDPYYEDKKEIIEYVYDVIEFHRGKFMKGESKYHISDIIAWKEIEPFEEEV